MFRSLCSNIYLFFFQQNNFISIDAEDMLKNPDQSILKIENCQLVFYIV